MDRLKGTTIYKVFLVTSTPDPLDSDYDTPSLGPVTTYYTNRGILVIRFVVRTRGTTVERQTPIR